MGGREGATTVGPIMPGIDMDRTGNKKRIGMKLIKNALLRRFALMLLAKLNYCMNFPSAGLKNIH